MKAAPFAYARPGTVDDALTELGRDGAKVIAGGQSLVPVLAMRLARPTTLVDINAIDELYVLDADGDTLRVGACVRQRTIQRDAKGAAVPLLRLALPWVGHRELRSRGTVCGSLAHADPAAELPAVAACLDATLTIRSRDGERTVAASDFFTAAMTTATQPEELVTSVHFPHAKPHEGFGFAEIGRRHGDFALAGVAVRVGAGDPIRPTARVTAFGISDRPIVRDVSTLVREAVATDGSQTPEAALRAALVDGAAALAEDVVDTGGDAHGSTAYRRQLIAALASREIARAYVRATASSTVEGPA